MDMLYISGLEIDTIIGIHDWEQNIKQTLVIDIEIACEITQAAETDDISKACDYAAISEHVTRFVESNHFQLIETVAEQTAQLILREFKVPRVKLCISKPGAVGNAQNVGIRIERP
jgi:dihydroneopterin aldolase